MLTMTKRPTVEAFGEVVPSRFCDDSRYRGAAVSYSRLGRIVKDSLPILSEIEPAVRLLQYVVMPDHIHLLIHVQREIEEPIGNAVARWKTEVNDLAGEKSIFEASFNDQILTPNRSLDVLYRYIRENPYRLLVRRENPDFFSRRSNIVIDGVIYQSYGNHQLLDIPFKRQVLVHRRDTAEEYAANLEKCRYVYSNGGVLVSPFISPRERDIYRECVANDGSLIIIIAERMGERYKPSGELFDLCTKGKLLLISISRSNNGHVTREDCLEMNRIAGWAGDDGLGGVGGNCYLCGKSNIVYI